MTFASRLIVGLGNPGSEYEATRHNIGFMVLDVLAKHYRCLAWKKKFKGLITRAETQNVFFLKPLTYMNLSGDSVLEAMQYYKLKVEDIIVFHDDLDLAPGQIKVKQGGGAGGHNGLKSLDGCVGPNYWRIRLGIGHPGVKVEVTNYVLGGFAKTDYLWLEPLLNALAQEFDIMLAGQPMNYLSRVTQKTMTKQGNGHGV